MAGKNKTQRRHTQSKRIKHKQSKRIKHTKSKRIKHTKNKRTRNKKRMQSGGLLPFSDFKNGTYNFFENVGNQWAGKPLQSSYDSHDQRLIQT
jgi:hypothetical protein